MDEIATELTAEKLQTWLSGTLDLKYCSLVSDLARICLYNRLPSSNNNKLSQEAAMLLYRIKMGYNVNLGERILKHLENSKNRGIRVHLILPSTIFAVLQLQGIKSEPMMSIIPASNPSLSPSNCWKHMTGYVIFHG